MEPVSNLGKFGRTLLIVVGMILMVVGIFFTSKQNISDSNTGECTATIVGFEKATRNTKARTEYTETIVNYKIGSREYKNVSLGQYEAQWNVGDKLTILYSKDDPSDIKTKTMTYGGWLIILLSLPFISIGIFMLVTMRRRAAKTPQEIAEDEERTTAGKLKYKVSSIFIPLSAGIPITAMGLIFQLLEHNSVLGILLIILGGVAVFAGLRSVFLYIIIKYRHRKEIKKFLKKQSEIKKLNA